MTKPGKAFPKGNIPGTWAGSGTDGGGHTKGLALLTGVSHVAATSGRGGMAITKDMNNAMRRRNKPGWHRVFSPSKNAARVNFGEEAMAYGMASLRGHLYGLGSSRCDPLHEATLRDAFVTIPPYPPSDAEGEGLRGMVFAPPTPSGMKKSVIILLLISLPIAAVAFGVETDSKIMEPAAETAVATVPEDQQAILETLRTSGYTVFAELLEKTGVLGELKQGEPFTCFAPRNEAFKMEAFKKLMEDPKNDELLDLVKYHFIQGNQPKEIILISRRERTLNGKFLLYWITKGEISINNHSEIIEADIKTKGGVIHGVSKILRPDIEGAIP